MHDVVSLLKQLVAIDSVNPELVPGGSGEAAIAAFVAQWLETAGLQVTLQDAGNGRSNVIATVTGTGGGKSLMLNAHTDTVSYVGMANPLEPVIDGGKLFGRGSYDMKGALAAIMVASANLAKNPPRGDVILTAVVDEEFASIGTQAVVDRYRADAAIITEPTSLDLCVAHKGFVWAELETQGLAAHGSLPNVGIDAIAKMGPVISGIAALDRSLRAGRKHPLLGTGSIHCSLVSGGTELSTYPDRCVLQVERRTIPGETEEQVDNELADIMESVALGDSDFVGSTLITITRNAFEIPENAPIASAVRSAVRIVTGRDPKVTGGTGWMDSSILDAAGIPTVIFGPTGEGAHALVEWVDLASVEQCVAVYERVAREWCA